MKITVVSCGSPVPADTGGRNDIWRRLCAFRKHGVECQLIFWHSDGQPKLTEDDLQRLRSVATRLHILRIGLDVRSLLRRAALLLKYPSHFSARILSRHDLIAILQEAKEFEPDCIWLDGIDGGPLAEYLAENLGIPLFLRSNNIEFEYRRKLVAAATDLKTRLSFFLACMHLEKFEKRLIQRADHVFECSMDNLAYWRNTLGINNGSWLPPFVDEAFILPHKNDKRPIFDIAYLGGLSIPNNVEGVQWFVERVLPSITKVLPDVKVAIGGSSPCKHIENICAQSPNVTLVPNPRSALDFFQSASVLINPVKYCAGINVKSIEMLFLGKPVVTTTAGIYGLPDEAKRTFFATDSEDAMAAMILDILVGRITSAPNACNVLKYFCPDSVKELIEQLQIYIGNQRQHEFNKIL